MAVFWPHTLFPVAPSAADRQLGQFAGSMRLQFGADSCTYVCKPVQYGGVQYLYLYANRVKYLLRLRSFGQY